MEIQKYKVNKVDISRVTYTKSKFSVVKITVVSEDYNGKIEEFDVRLFSGTGRKMPKVTVNKIEKTE
tara:strand:- start:275 stop:475 length:201 start_codon:yes stop_codon:yes gene_type:complete